MVPADLVARADEMGDKLDPAQQIIDTQIKIGLTDLAPLMVDVADGAASFASWLGQGYQNTKLMASLNDDLQGLGQNLSKVQQEQEEFKFQGSQEQIDRYGRTYVADQDDATSGGVTQRQFEWFTGQQLIPHQAAKIASDTATSIVGDAGIDLALNPSLDFPDKFATGIEDMNMRSSSALEQLRGSTELGKLAFAGLGDSAKAAADMSASSVLGSASQITGVLAGAFEDNKLLAAANIAVSTAAGVMKAWEQGGMFAAPMAAAIGLAGAMQLANVRNAKVGSAKISAPIPSLTPAAVSAPAAASPSQTVHITLQGTPKRDTIRQFIEQLQTAAGDGMRLNFTDS